MVSIFAKARIYRGNTQVHLQFFCKPKLQSTWKGRAVTQMSRSSASSKISFHGLPGKTKRPSIRKHSVVVIITVNSISFCETAICREIFSKQFFVSIFVNSASKYVPKSFRNFTRIHPWQSLMLLKLQVFTGATTGCVL